MINAKIIADSKNLNGDRLTTFILTYPRIIHSEILTHRAFSRNSASSRAVPTEKLIDSIITTPFIPIQFQKKHKGMQGTEYFNETDSNELKKIWLEARDYAIKQAKKMHEFGVTKQLINRLLEPYQYYTTIVTATEYENFFKLRCPQYSLFYEQIPMTFRSRKDLINFTKKVESPEFKNQYDNLTELEWLGINKGQAEIHIMALAEAMWDAYNESIPKKLNDGEWHIPFGDNFDNEKLKELIPEIQKVSLNDYCNSLNELKVKIATARCARVSYTVVGEEGKPDNYYNDLKLHDRLAESRHASPFEHCAKAMSGIRSRNFVGFQQYREICNL